VRSAYLVGRQPRAKLLLNQQDPAMLSRVMTYFGYLNRARAQRIAAIQSKVRNLQEIQQRLTEQTEALQALELRQLAVVEQLEAGRVQRGAALDSLERRIRDQGRQLRQLQADERELQKLMDSLRDVLADIPMDMDPGKPFAQQRGKLPWPLRGPLLAGYGAPKDDGRMKWNGLWISGTQGAPVRAVAHGRVAYVGWMHRYGLIVVVEHPGGWFTLYGHNDSAARAVGEWVRAGDEIARIGSTGGHDKPGVYFEIRRGADTVNPREWLAR
jgi:murein hydrolase activator